MNSNQTITPVFKNEKFRVYQNNSELMLVYLDLMKAEYFNVNESDEEYDAFYDKVSTDFELEEYEVYGETIPPGMAQFLIEKIQSDQKILIKFENHLKCANKKLHPVIEEVPLFYAKTWNCKKTKDEIKDWSEQMWLRTAKILSRDLLPISIGDKVETVAYDSNFTHVLFTSNANIVIHFVPRVVSIGITPNASKKIKNLSKKFKRLNYEVLIAKAPMAEIIRVRNKIKKDNFEEIRIIEQLDVIRMVEMKDDLHKKVKGDLDILVQDIPKPNSTIH